MRETMTSGTATRVFDFIYDESGKPFACKYTINGTTTTTMYYVLNLQGDVVRILNANGSTMVKYAYNAWGEVISVTNANDVAITSATHIGNLNPLRYRGYYYDTETGFYYLQSRYYDPAMHRFINADSLASTGQGFIGTNMFAYCNNNPVIYSDEAGNSAMHIVGIGAEFVLYAGEGGNDEEKPTTPTTVDKTKSKTNYSDKVMVSYYVKIGTRLNYIIPSFTVLKGRRIISSTGNIPIIIIDIKRRKLSVAQRKMLEDAMLADRNLASYAGEYEIDALFGELMGGLMAMGGPGSPGGKDKDFSLYD